ncbi:MAG: hypothetical protein KA184_20910, partial [Candidatus Hydrogenedentes bacterium]|nr:hypothetical protein [Candidatus Hydrogenedentota bacterium]
MAQALLDGSAGRCYTAPRGVHVRKKVFLDMFWLSTRGKPALMHVISQNTQLIAPCNAPEFSIVITAYCEEDCIEEFHGRLTAVMTALGRSFEIVYVNDGSTDATFSR